MRACTMHKVMIVFVVSCILPFVLYGMDTSCQKSDNTIMATSDSINQVIKDNSSVEAVVQLINLMPGERFKITLRDGTKLEGRLVIVNDTVRISEAKYISLTQYTKKKL